MKHFPGPGSMARDTADSWASDVVLLTARVLLVVLFVLFGWSELTGFPAAVSEMVGFHLPLPTVAAMVVVIMEFFVGSAIALGLCTRPLAVLLAVYTLASGLIAHRYWTMSGADYIDNEINFYKNVSIVGGLLLLAVTGAGRLSLDRRIRRAREGHGR